MILAAPMLFVALGMSPAFGQKSIGFAPLVLTQSEYVFDTAEERDVRVVVVARGLRHPWSVVLLPSGDALVSERGAGLRLVRGACGAGAVLDPDLIAGLPTFSVPRLKGGPHDVVLHPPVGRDLVVVRVDAGESRIMDVGDRASSRRGALVMLRSLASSGVRRSERMARALAQPAFLAFQLSFSVCYARLSGYNNSL